MHSNVAIFSIFCLVAGLTMPAVGQRAGGSVSAGQGTNADPIKALVDQLDVEKYTATIRGLTQFGDRRQGTDRNRAAVDWIEAQLKSYGCPTETRSSASLRSSPSPQRL